MPSGCACSLSRCSAKRGLGLREMQCPMIGLAGPFVFQVVIIRILQHWREACRPLFVTVSMARRARFSLAMVRQDRGDGPIQPRNASTAPAIFYEHHNCREKKECEHACRDEATQHTNRNGTRKMSSSPLS